MERRYQVFISSTFEDLKEARSEVGQALLRASCFPAGMELFPAADEQQFEFIKRVIDESDYYIIISAGKYGTISPESGLSYTEMEYDYAVSNGKPVIRLLHRDPFNQLRGELIEQSDERRKKLERFREKLTSRSLVNFWKSHDELGKQVVFGLLQAQKSSPAVGWKRADGTGDTDAALQLLLDEVARTKKNPADFFEELPLPVLRLTLKGEVISASSQAKSLLGDLAEKGVFFFDRVSGLGRPFELWAREIVETGSALRREMVTINRVSGELHLRASLNHVSDSDGEHFLAVLDDATELRAIEWQFAQSQKMQLVGQLAAGVAHDFNNLLTAISGHCDLLLLRRDADDPDFADLSQIAQNANRAAAVVNQLLGFSGKQRLRLETLDLADIISDLMHLLGRLVGDRVQLALDVDPHTKMVRADKFQLEQVLTNLVVNARDALMPEGGQVRLQLGNHYLDLPLERDRTVIPPGDYVMIRVIDDGTGISSDKAGKIFEPYYSTKGTSGTGLGLSMAYGIVKQSGGFIFFDSVEGQGSTFSLYFPAVRDGDDPHGKASILEIPDWNRSDFAGVRILLAEDQAPVAAFIKRALELSGANVTVARDGQEALWVMRQNEGRFDLIISDVVMPNLDGPTWVMEAQETWGDIRTIFVSGFAQDVLSESGSRPKNFEFLPKPFSLTEITALVRRVLNGKSPT